jgi:protoporphyrinogen oxidase
MKIAIIGAGFTGLSAAYTLAKQGHSVTVFEKDSQSGGLAIGYQEKNWDWTLERHYHHWFTSDNFILDLAKEIGHTVIIKRPKTSVYINNQIYKLDSPIAFLLFPVLPFLDRARMLIALGLLRINPYWKPLEKIRATDVLPKIMGHAAWKTVWQPQLSNKMGNYAKDISLVWFWTRINKRSPYLAYPEGGFLSFANHLVQKINSLEGRVIFDTETIEIKDEAQVLVTVKQEGKSIEHTFDQVIVTLPTFLFASITKDLPKEYLSRMAKLEGLSATNLVLRLKQPFLPDNTYWLSICNPNSPVMAVIEHTNFMDKSHYSKEHIIYIGNYAVTHDKLDWSKEKLLKFYDPFLQQLHPNYETELIGYELFKAPFAQPIIPINYSKQILEMTTPLPHVFLANMQQVYPWDRGTNYAVELGQKVAALITS